MKKTWKLIWLRAHPLLISGTTPWAYCKRWLTSRKICPPMTWSFTAIQSKMASLKENYRAWSPYGSCLTAAVTLISSTLYSQCWTSRRVINATKNYSWKSSNKWRNSWKRSTAVKSQKTPYFSGQDKKRMTKETTALKAFLNPSVRELHQPKSTCLLQTLTLTLERSAGSGRLIPLIPAIRLKCKPKSFGTSTIR